MCMDLYGIHVGLENFQHLSLSICRLGKPKLTNVFGLFVVLSGGKICIEKMLGFRGDAVFFIFKPIFFLP